MTRFAESLSALSTDLAAGGRERRTADPVCDFCGWPSSSVPGMLSGPGASICSDCVEHAHRTVLPAVRTARAAPAAAPQLVPLTAPRAGPPPDPREPVLARARQADALLDQVAASCAQGLEAAGALAGSIERFLASASSDKLLLLLPWDELSRAASALGRLARTIEEGKIEAAGVART
jgi:hypothetical protein